MRPSEFEAIRPHLQEAFDYIDADLKSGQSLENDKELHELFNRLAALPEGTPSKVKLHTLTEEEQAELSRSFRTPLIEHAYPWRHSAARAAADLRDCGWIKEAEKIAEALSGLPTGPVDGNRPENMARQFGAIREVGERVRAILAKCLAGCNSNGDDTAPPSADRREGPPKPPAPLVKLLVNWPEILIALGMKNNREDKRNVSRLNKTYSGPITIPGQGKQPLVNRAELLEWWGGLAAMVKAEQERQRDARATVSAQHRYGGEGEVIPDLAGEVKRRRRNRRP